MPVSNRYPQLFQEKVSQIERAAPNTFRYSHILLFAEYQTRLFQWKQALKSEVIDLFNKNKTFHNLFIDLSPGWSDELISEEKVVNDLKDLGFSGIRTSHRDYYGFFTCMYINWELFKNRPELRKHENLPHPYETVFLMFCRGATIFNAERMFDIDNRTYVKHNNEFHLPSLDQKFLDFVDKNDSNIKRKNYADQLEVDRLWAEALTLIPPDIDSQE